MSVDRAGSSKDIPRLPPPSQALHRALQLADFNDVESMRALEAEVRSYAQALRTAYASQVYITNTVRALVDESLFTRAVPVRTSESRKRLLDLAAEWSTARPA